MTEQKDQPLEVADCYVCSKVLRIVLYSYQLNFCAPQALLRHKRTLTAEFICNYIALDRDSYSEINTD